MQLDQGRHLGEVPFYCAQGRSAPSGWQTRRLTVFIPTGELDGAGRTVRYVYSRSFSDGRPFASATCVVPYTEGALRRLDRAFDVRENGGVDQFRLRAAMVTTQGCVTDDAGCALDPMFVKPPPVQPVTDPEDVCTRYPGECDDTGGGGGEDGWNDADGDADGGSGSGSPFEAGPLTWAACIGAGLGAIGGSMLSYASLEQYHAATTAYNIARLRYEGARTYSEQTAYGNDMRVAERNLNAMTYALAGSGIVTVAAFIGVVTLCSPSILFPTP